MRRRRRRRAPLPHPTIIDVEPEDAPRVFEEGELEAVDVRPNEPVEEGAEEEHEKDTGLLYGVHEPPATETELAAGEDHDAYRGADLGENFIEVLVEKSAELGPLPEHEIDVVDESDPEAPPSPTDHRDRPKADRGSGGPGGL